MKYRCCVARLGFVFAAGTCMGCGTVSSVEDGKSLDKEIVHGSKTENPHTTGSQETEMDPNGVARHRISASHILVMHAESKQNIGKITRTKEAAAVRILEALEKVRGGEDFGAVAAAYSDCPTKINGGDLGIFSFSRMSPEFTKATLALRIGEVSEPIETEFGYHIIKRQKVEEVHARHILVMYSESKRRPTAITRTKAEARARIEAIAARVHASGADFGAIARATSDCPSKYRGGDLGTFGKGRMAPPFEEAVFALEDNEISDVVETEFGFHIIQRLSVE